MVLKSHFFFIVYILPNYSRSTFFLKQFTNIIKFELNNKHYKNNNKRDIYVHIIPNFNIKNEK